MLRFFTSDLRRNLTKILCLTVGLSVGFLLVAKIYFDQSFDSFLPLANKIYLITESAVDQGNRWEGEATPGGTANELKRNIPQIEEATRFTYLTGQTTMRLEDGRLLDVDGICLADTCFFDVLSTPVIEGDPHEILDVEDRVMIPRSLAEKIGGNVIGMRMSNVFYGDDYKVTVGGVYEDYPLNSTISNVIYLSLCTLPKFMPDGRDNLIGNDRYRSFVLLHDGADPDEMHVQAMRALKDKIPPEAFDISDYKVFFRPLVGRHASESSVRRMSWMMGLLAVVMLMCAALNYLLIVIGQLAARSKEMAIRKCYGTSFPKLFAIIMGESVFFLFVSLGLAVLLAFSFSDLFHELLGYTPRQLLSTPKVWIVEACVCLVLLVFTGVIPAVIYSRTPVAHAFRPSAKGRKGWKLILLSVQFFASGLLLCMLVLVGRQYRFVSNLDMGMEYENVGVFMRNAISEERARALVGELRALSCVEGVASASRDFSRYASGNMLWTEGNYDNQVNVADMEWANPEIVDVLGLRITDGRNFHAATDSLSREVLVEKRLVDVFRKQFGFEGDEIVGEKFYITGHGGDDTGVPEMTIAGVIDNLRRGGYESESVDKRAGVLFPSNWIWPNVYVRFTELTPENLKKAQAVIDSFSDSDEIYIHPYKSDVDSLRNPIVRFGTAVAVVSIVILLIALIGLIGYVADEVNRRSKEIAIRKVNGTSERKIVRLFCMDILRIALPALILGAVAAMVLGNWWLSQFTDRVSLSPVLMMVCIIVLLLLITAIVIINSFRVARTNPVYHLRDE